MTMKSHRRLLGVLLTIVSVLNISVGFGMLATIPFAEFERDHLGRVISSFIYLLVCASIALFFAQLLVSIIYLVTGGSSRTLGLVASVSSILAGLGLPVGVYGIWLLASSSSDEEASRS